jgi:excinuclease ABC subunit A
MATASALSSIRIRGARVHNLRNVDIDIPHGKLTVITGVSGSGKSSLAFDTLFAEGQRQYIDSLSAYARQFLQQIPRPDVDHVEGLQPTLCIDQKTGSTHPRSTVATVTEIYDYLRLLYARVGIPHCTACGTAISQQSADQIIATLRQIPEETKLVLLAPMIRGRRGTHREVFEKIRSNGWLRARVDGEIHSLDELPELAPRKLHTIEAVVDRLVVRPGNEHRLTESAQLTLRTGGGVMTVLSQAAGEQPWREQLLSTLFACPNCGQSFQELEPRTFSFNSPYGACPTCDGLGRHDETICSDCQGGRLKPEALAVTILDRNIAELTATAIGDAINWFSALNESLAPSLRPIAERITNEIRHRLEFLQAVGLHYLTLDRPAATLSGGELQRVRLANGLGSGLVGVCYVLDEPSIGLHPSDNDRLIESIRHLQSQGNTVVVVEHDEAMMRVADRLIDMGPGAGPAGGQIISQGPPSKVARDRRSITGPYLSGKMTVPFPAHRREPVDGNWIELSGVTTHNLKGITARFPLGLLVGVTGVSGSGKSSLVNDTLVPAIRDLLSRGSALKLTAGRTLPDSRLKVAEPVSAYRDSGQFLDLKGAESIDKLIPIDQTPIGRGPRSCPATYTGVLDEIRKVFAATREAKQRGFKSNRFSFNTSSGACEVCKGQGLQKIEMNFLSDLYVVCSRCGGKRYNRQTLMVRFKGHSIADILEMTVDEASEFFQNFAKIDHILASLREIGLGYLQLGQASTTLSGGEAQRVKLATELAGAQRGHTLYILDEPTTGLHFVDIARLLTVLGRLVDAGNTVIVIEHNLDVIKACDWLLDIGPTGGRDGGYLIGAGSPETIAALPDSLTGRYLRPLLAK